MKKIPKKNKSLKSPLVERDYVAVLSKAAAVSFVAVVSFFGMNHIGVTSSYYNDKETSQNILQAGVVDIELINGGFETLESYLNFGSGQTLQKQIKVLGGPQSNPFLYSATTTNIAGDLSFCQEIGFDVDLNESLAWQTGVLESFVSATTTLYATSTGDNWNINFNLPASSSTPNSVCSFDFVYNAVQYPEPIGEWGFVDSEIAATTIYSWGLRINKVYYDVASDRGAEGKNEWVEIYNQTDTDIDMTGWGICDADTCDTVPSSDPIPAKGFAVITPDESTWDYWQRENGVVSILLDDSRIGSGLNNDADMLVLKRPDGMIIDQMNWGTPVTTWTKYNDNLWNSGAVDVSEGSTLGRKPNGFDTNQASDFVKLSPPLLSLIYPDQSGILTWHWTYDYDIEWNARNPNGEDEDLSINLSYVQDTDGDQSLSLVDGEFIIGKNILNTGIFNWTVPSGFTGYIWLKIAAFSPENPILNTSLISGKVYSPAPAKILVTEPEEPVEILGALTLAPLEDEEIIEDKEPSASGSIEEVPIETKEPEEQVEQTGEVVVEVEEAILPEPAEDNVEVQE